MSDTNRGEKGPGYDYWSRRHPANGIMPTGKFAKHITHKRERREAKKEINEQTRFSN